MTISLCRHCLLDAQKHRHQALPSQSGYSHLSPGGHLRHRHSLQQSQHQVTRTEHCHRSKESCHFFYFRPTDNIGFSYIRRKLNSCLFKQTVTTHNVKLPEMKAIYDKLQSSKNHVCPTIKARLLREYGPGKCTGVRSTLSVLLVLLLPCCLILL